MILNKKAQGQKIGNFLQLSGKAGQEEMVGFAVILVIVSIALLVVLSFFIRKPNTDNIESYEVESFIASSLQYTTDCENYLGFMPVQELVISCENGGSCLDGRKSCDILNSTLEDLISKSWAVGEDSPVKGYKLQIKVGEEESLTILKGNMSGNSRGDFQDFARSNKKYEFSLILYS